VLIPVEVRYEVVVHVFVPSYFAFRYPGYGYQRHAQRELSAQEAAQAARVDVATRITGILLRKYEERQENSVEFKDISGKSHWNMVEKLTLHYVDQLLEVPIYLTEAEAKRQGQVQGMRGRNIPMAAFAAASAKVKAAIIELNQQLEDEFSQAMVDNKNMDIDPQVREVQ
jgi:Pyruvate/2-oxoacid:ferredoxin oxidoreductase gamma subunit